MAPSGIMAVKEFRIMQTATVEEAQARLPELLTELAEGREVLITRNGAPVGNLVPAPLPKGVPIPGRGKGKLIIYSDDDDHLKDFEEYMP
jgi:prevent-host-death family protein